MSRKHIVNTSDAPPAVGPFSQATTNGELVFTAGQIALTSDGESLTDESIAVQTRQSLDNLTTVLEEAGASARDVLKVTVFLADMGTYDEMNESYEEYFSDEPPARSAVEVANLPLGADVEIEAVAMLKNP